VIESGQISQLQGIGKGKKTWDRNVEMLVEYLGNEKTIPDLAMSYNIGLRTCYKILRGTAHRIVMLEHHLSEPLKLPPRPKTSRRRKGFNNHFVATSEQVAKLVQQEYSGDQIMNKLGITGSELTQHRRLLEPKGVKVPLVVEMRSSINIWKKIRILQTSNSDASIQKALSSLSRHLLTQLSTENYALVDVLSHSVREMGFTVNPRQIGEITKLLRESKIPYAHKYRKGKNKTKKASQYFIATKHKPRIKKVFVESGLLKKRPRRAKES
jgi:hypothetical protein